MRTALLTAFLALAMYAAPQQEQKPSPSPDQNPKQTSAAQPTPAGPVSLSPMVPVAGAVKPDATGATPGATPGAKPRTPGPASSRTYVIGAEDIIAIHVFENQGFSVPTQIVRPDGMIAMPLVGEILAANKTPEELSDEITKVLVDKYMKEPPHVQVIVLDVRSKNYYLQGEVNKPGKYALVVPTTIMQALVNAGGFRDFANKKNIKIQRGDKMFKFNYVEVTKGKHLEQNILLQPDDQIYVH
jgi:polysaccharide biosynthesis/export protein